MSSTTAARSNARFAILVTLAVLTVGAIIVAGLLATRPGPTAPEAGVSLVTPDTQLPAEGSSGVELVEFGDFECPACATFEPYLDELRERYAGELTIAFRHFPLPQHTHAIDAALAAEAAGLQGRFAEMHDLLYATQGEWSGADDAAALFRGYAERLGLDLAAYDTAVADAGTRAAVDADAEAGAALGVNSTPTFYLDGKRLELTRYTDLADAVEAALADAR